ncbi:perosamine synthetase [Micromonospora sp. M71_S20]|uniref:DegT/DnrJ/EryC1/StrS family aminotransferase n=1 Tax=Micromonospora sp. M71_S20 TaxID=592872 RepID=UPI000EB2A652|nr:DegT/DnrJ/EryC1/StrS family aminotransferase [Micromonospora sp. M71_S20]RLK09476.1 perosamine synthetase [Micromonospora sp. M71_S20]
MTIALPGGASRNAGPILYGPEIKAVTDALLAGHYGHGPITERFETDLANYLGVPDVVCVATGTVAMQLALLTAGIGPGDEVIVPSLTFCSTIQAIIATGANPVFIEVDKSSLCVRADDILAAVTSTTRAVMPVLYSGRAVDLTGIQEHLNDSGIHIIEDAAQAFGSNLDGRLVGTNRRIMTCFSFGPMKNLTCGEGGAIVPRTPEQAEKLRRMRTTGIAQTLAQRAEATTYDVIGFGVRAHLQSMNAAIGSVQLANFDQARMIRQQLWHRYAAALADLPNVELTDVDIDHTVPFNCVVQIPDRNRIFHQMRAAGIGVGVHYPPNHLQPAFEQWTTSLPATEEIGQRILTLPFHPSLSSDDIDRVVAALHDALAG